MSTTYALVAIVRFHGTTVEQRHVPRGRPLVIGQGDELAVPLPSGMPFLARCTWRGPDKVAVVDGRGRTWELGPEDRAEVTLGPVELELSMAPQFALKRSYRFDTLLSAVWLAVVLMATVTGETVALGYKNWCSWGYTSFLAAGSPSGLAPAFAQCMPNGGDSSGIVTAEYLARLLREDFDGEDVGAVVKEIDRPDPVKVAERDYLPAGDRGPIDKMGGAEEVTPDPVRTPDEEPSIPEKGVEAQEPLIAEEVGAEVELPPEQDELGEDGIVDAEQVDDGDDHEPPSEEERGWGIRDWYDEQDQRVDNDEVADMIRGAKRLLAIDPDSQTALSILSYYQYLAQDYEEAIKTYDRYIALFPDSAAGYNNKALVYKRLGEYETEELLYRVALAIDPEDFTALNNLAVNLAHQGQHAEAIAIMQHLETVDPGDAYADLHRSKIYAEIGDTQMALHYLDKALAGMKALDTLHHIEFRQDIRVDPSFAKLRETRAFRDVLIRYYGDDTPLQEG